MQQIREQYETTVCAVTRVFAEGEKVIAAVAAYPAELLAGQLQVSAYGVKDRRILRVYPSRDGTLQPAEQGRFVVLELDREEKEADVTIMVGKGPHGRTAIREAKLCVSQNVPLLACNGTALPPFYDKRSSEVRREIIKEFQCKTFCTQENGKHLQYQLFCPKEYKACGQYPLVVFLHDAGSCSDDVTAPLAQGLGAVIWADGEEQKKRPCFVAAPCYPEVCANDDYQVTWQADATIALVKRISEDYPIDRNRIYGTGQSMGCMMLCELNLRYPDFFAGCLLTAGQWNPETMAAAGRQNLWAVVSQGDRKAYPIMGACMDAMEQAGFCVSRAGIDAKDPDTVLNERLREQWKQGEHLYFTWFEGNSVLPAGAMDSPGEHHVRTWARAYEPEALREWLFAQKKERTGE